MKLHLISLGCAKNLVDSEVLAGKMALAGFLHTTNLSEADVIILNTCAFITPARKEAYHYIKKIIHTINSKTYNLYKPVFVVTGCLPQIEYSTLLKKFPEIDFIFGTDQFIKIPQVVKTFLNPNSVSKCPVSKNKKIFVREPKYLYSNSTPRIVSTPKSFAYLKIADGCDNRCSYCLIPTIRGKYRERPIEDIVAEARKLVSCGTKEIILVSQDTTFYGMRIYKQQMLHVLIKKLATIPNLHWIRILYTNPKHFYPELIKTIADTEQVCKYIELPIQHTDDTILNLMNRGTKKQIFNTIEQLRKNIPNITLRTTVMVGFPSETEKQFETLLSDIKTLNFDWLGCFQYSNQIGTQSFVLKNQVTTKIKLLRYNKIMEAQQKIMLTKNYSHIGKVYPVLLDTQNSGHTEFQAPEIDGKVILKNFVSNNQKTIVNLRIVSVSKVYDLIAEPINF